MNENMLSDEQENDSGVIRKIKGELTIVTVKIAENSIELISMPKLSNYFTLYPFKSVTVNSLCLRPPCYLF